MYSKWWYRNNAVALVDMSNGELWLCAFIMLYLGLPLHENNKNGNLGYLALLGRGLEMLSS